MKCSIVHFVEGFQHITSPESTRSERNYSKILKTKSLQTLEIISKRSQHISVVEYT